MIRVYGLLLLVVFVYALLDVILSEATLIRNLPKLVWVFLVVFLTPIGAIAWFVAGRPLGTTAAPGSTRSRGRQPGRNASTRGNPAHPAGGHKRKPPRGPDDDPDFLRSLDERLRRQNDDPADEPKG